MQLATVPELLERYRVFLLDAFGVLVNTAGPLPGAAEFLANLRAEGKTMLLLSNDASRLTKAVRARYGQFGLHFAEEEIVTSGCMIESAFEDDDLVGARTIVLGTEDSRTLVERAGGVLVPPDDLEARVVVAADDEGYPFLAGVEQTLSTLIHRIDRGLPVELMVPNPDLIYPKGADQYGLTGGSVALLIEAGLRVRFGDRAPKFQGLGKPFARIFDHAHARVGHPNKSEMVMLGDQLGTDVAGATAFGIDSVLLGTGLTHFDVSDLPEDSFDPSPTWVLESL